MSFNQGNMPPYFNNCSYGRGFSPYFYPFATHPANLNYLPSYNYAQIPSGNYLPFYLSQQLGFYQYPRTYNPNHPSTFSMQMPLYPQRAIDFRVASSEKKEVKRTTEQAPIPQVIDLCEQSEKKTVKQVQPKKQQVIEKPKQKLEQPQNNLPKKRRIKPFKIDEYYVNYTNIKFPTRAKTQSASQSQKKQQAKNMEKSTSQKNQINDVFSIKRKKIIKKTNAAIPKSKSKSNTVRTKNNQSIFVPLQIKIGPQHQCEVPHMIFSTSEKWPQYEQNKMDKLKNLLIRKFY